MHALYVVAHVQHITYVGVDFELDENDMYVALFFVGLDALIGLKFVASQYLILKKKVQRDYF